MTGTPFETAGGALARIPNVVDALASGTVRPATAHRNIMEALDVASAAVSQLSGPQAAITRIRLYETANIIEGIYNLKGADLGASFVMEYAVRLRSIARKAA